MVALPDIAIASLNQVRSIQLVSKKPIEEIRTVAVDTSSRTSVGLTQVLLTKFFGGHRELTPMAPELGAMLERCDAGLLIGDPAMMVDISGLYAYDLAEMWRAKTGLPFVFAVWTVRKAALAEMRAGVDLGGIFRRSRDHGLLPENVAAIAKEWSQRMGLSEAGDHRTICGRISTTAGCGVQKGTGAVLSAGRGMRRDRARAGAGVLGRRH